VAVDIAAAPNPARAGLALVERVAAAPAALVLGVLVALSAAIRTLVAFGHAVHVYFPDEYIYSALARGFAEHGRPVIRGHSAHFPSLLEPILAAPFWLSGDPLLAYRLTQAENALLMSLGAIPVYLLSRRLGAGKWLGVGLAALAVATPDFFFSSFVLTGPVAYPLVLAAVYAGVCALDRPTRLNQLAFVGLSGLAAFARIQYVVLPVALVVAALVVERGSARAVVGRLRLTLGILAGAGGLFLAAGPARALGYYSGVADQHLRPFGLLHWTGVDAMLLAYSAGLVLVPGALVGLALALVRPRSRAEAAFAGLTVALGAFVFAEAALYASNGSERYQERYFMALVPLLAVAFALYARRGLPGRKFVAVFSAGFIALAASVPLSGYTNGDGKQDSPLLFAVFRLEKLFAGAGGGSLAVALCATALCALAIGLSFLGRRAVPLGVAATALVFAAVSFGAYSVDRTNAAEIRNDYLPSDRQWIDRARLGDVALIETPGAGFGRALEQMVWNRSVDSVYLLGGAKPVDNFGSAEVGIAPDGRLITKSGHLQKALLIENRAVQIRLSGAQRVARGGSFELWKPVGTPRVDLITFGRYSDGWLAGEGRVVVWPNAAGRVDGTLKLLLRSPSYASPLRLTLRGKGVQRSVFFAPGQRREVAVAVHARGVWQLDFTSSMHGTLWDGRPVSVRVTGPTFQRS
jgi:hypothetical protein